METETTGIEQKYESMEASRMTLYKKDGTIIGQKMINECARNADKLAFAEEILGKKLTVEEMKDYYVECLSVNLSRSIYSLAIFHQVLNRKY